MSEGAMESKYIRSTLPSSVTLTDALSSISSVAKPTATLVCPWAVEAIRIQITLCYGRLAFVNI